MGVLRKVEGQYERFGTGVLDFNTTSRKCGLRDESDLRIDLSKDHILMIPDFELSNLTATAIGVEKGGTVGPESRFGTRADGKTQN